MKARLIGALTLGLLTAASAHASWSNVTSPAELRALHANTTLDGGQAFYGHFYEGGFGVMRQNGAKLRAPWHFNGNSEMCIEFQEGTECFRYQRNGDFSTQYRAVRVRDGLAIPVSVERSVPEY